ncbi:SDR family NAD(P)-dependent oxidoreductase [Massilia sp. CFBP9012]|uniref:SDR family NAD(P)-dependent oxidoreductase n=1 Tax=Massilia sp. CFBP9012 TaxID=3096531 RepID=UPI0039C9472D
MSYRLQEKVAVITGASKGLGAAIAKHFAAEGASVVVNYSSSKKRPTISWTRSLKPVARRSPSGRICATRMTSGSHHGTRQAPHP